MLLRCFKFVLLTTIHSVIKSGGTAIVVAAPEQHDQAAKAHNLRRKVYVHPNQIQRVYIQYKNGSHDGVKRSLTSKKGKGTKLIHDFDDLNSFVVSTHEAELEKLRKDPRVMSIIEDAPRYQMYLEDTVTPYSNRGLNAIQGQDIPYGIRMVQAPSAWSYGVKGQGVKVCVIDSGLDQGHEDLNQTRLTGFDGGNYPWSHDAVGHGTHVTGTIAALDNDIGVIGVAPEAEIYTVRVFSDEGGFSYSSSLVNAAKECEAVGAKIISMSLGGPLWNPFEFRAFEQLFHAGILSIAAAGNSGTIMRSYPASYKGVMSVGAVDESKRLASFSQRNARIDVAAPGVDVLSLFPMGGNCMICDKVQESIIGYGTISGTSMATPHVSGVAALLWSFKNEASPEQIAQAIQESAEDLGENGRDNSFGHGLVNALDALTYMNNGIPLGEDITSPSDIYFAPNTNGQSSCATGEIYFRLALETDSNAEETWWNLARNSDSGVELAGAGYDDNSSISIEKCIPDNCYTFNLFDSFGDGICCTSGNGSYSLVIEDSEISKGGEFTYTESLTFGACHETTSRPNGKSTGTAYTAVTIESHEKTHQGIYNNNRPRSTVPTTSASATTATATQMKSIYGDDKKEDAEEDKEFLSGCVPIQLVVWNIDFNDAVFSELRIQLIDLIDGDNLWSYEHGYFSSNNSDSDITSNGNNNEYTFDACIDPGKCYKLELSNTNAGTNDSGNRDSNTTFELFYDHTVLVTKNTLAYRNSYELGDGCFVL